MCVLGGDECAAVVLVVLVCRGFPSSRFLYRIIFYIELIQNGMTSFKKYIELIHNGMTSFKKTLTLPKMCSWNHAVPR